MELKNTKYRWVMAVLFVATSTIGMYFVMVTAPIMTPMMEDMGLSLKAAGWLSTIVTTVSGLFQLVGVIILGRLGIKKCYILAASLCVVGNALCWIASSYPVLLIGRALVGVGFGIKGSMVAAVVIAWFTGKEIAAMFTANSIGCQVMMLLSYNITVPMYQAFGGSWQKIFMVCTIASVVLLVAWIVFGKDLESEKNREKANPFAGLKQAFASVDLWKLSILMTALTILNYGVSFYYPTFLSAEKGISDAAASSITSVQVVAGMIGTFLGGAAAMALKKRKSIIIPSCLLTIGAVILMLVFNSVPVLIVMMFAYGFVKNFNGPAVSTSSTEVKGMNPVMASGANFMLYGFGSFLTMIIAPLLGSMAETIGLTMAMIVFCGACAVIAAIASFVITETGKE